jgi:lactate dehydrogenase-like 2-hydroxyacid dehydrogenase
VGLGRIGKAIAQRASGFGMSIAYTARSAKTDSGFKFFATPAELAANVDFLVVITPGGAGTKHLINAEVLKTLGPRGFLINVARGSVVDEEALIAALQNGTIAGAGLDVFANEPHVPEVLWTMSNVVLTPHMASATHETRQAMADLAFANMQAGTSGQPLCSPVPECAALGK